MLPDALVSVEEPVHDADELAAGAGTEAGTVSTSGAAVGTAAGGTDGTKGTVALPEEYDATKPLPSTELSAENITSMLPEVAVTRGGMLLPLNAPSTVPLLLEPS